MYIKAQIVVESYMPHTLEKGMWFVRKHYEGTVREYSEIFELFRVPQDKDEFLTRNGYPVSLMVVQEYLDGSPPSILARSEEIGWWDEPEIDEYHTVDIDLVNLLINDYNGFVSIDVDPDGNPVLLSDQVVLSYPEDDEEEEFDETLCYNCGSNDIDFNSSGEYSCNNCGYEENEEKI